MPDEPEHDARHDELEAPADQIFRWDLHDLLYDVEDQECPSDGGDLRYAPDGGCRDRESVWRDREDLVAQIGATFGHHLRREDEQSEEPDEAAEPEGADLEDLEDPEVLYHHLGDDVCCRHQETGKGRLRHMLLVLEADAVHERRGIGIEAQKGEQCPHRHEADDVVLVEERSRTPHHEQHRAKALEVRLQVSQHRSRDHCTSEQDSTDRHEPLRQAGIHKPAPQQSCDRQDPDHHLDEDGVEEHRDEASQEEDDADRDEADPEDLDSPEPGDIPSCDL